MSNLLSCYKKIYAALSLICLTIALFIIPVKSALAQNQFIAGPWSHDGSLVSIIITPNQRLRFCNENNDCAQGFFTYPANITVPRWRVQGILQNGGSVIAWSNGTQWTRNIPMPAPININGQWLHDNNAVYIRLLFNGQFRMTNEVGQVSEGFFSNPYTLIVPSLDIQGVITPDGRMIRWSNNTVWIR